MNSREVEVMLLHLCQGAAPHKQQTTDEETLEVPEVPSLDHCIDSPASESLEEGFGL